MIRQFLKSVHYRRLFNNAPIPGDLEACREYIKASHTVLDLGANLGIYSKALSRFVGPQGQVHAVELMSDTFEYLHANVAKLGNVFCYNVGISDKTGTGYAYQPPIKHGHIYRARIAPKGTLVRLYRLDDLFSDLSPVFIKCDVEGAELEVIAGAKKMIECYHPIWLIETSRQDVFREMQRLGYVFQKLGQDWLFVHRVTQKESAPEST
jgi:FkbM family methyltransferase